MKKGFYIIYISSIYNTILLIVRTGTDSVILSKVNIYVSVRIYRGFYAFESCFYHQDSLMRRKKKNKNNANEFK